MNEYLVMFLVLICIDTLLLGLGLVAGGVMGWFLGYVSGIKKMYKAISGQRVANAGQD